MTASTTSQQAAGGSGPQGDGALWTGLVPTGALADDEVAALLAALPAGLPVLVARHDAGIDAVAIADDGEPLVRIDGTPHGIATTPAYRRKGLPGVPDGTWVRAGVADRLAEADTLLPDGLALHVLDGWRSLETQRALYAEVYFPGSAAEPGWVADPDDAHVPPPHSTGAAVDLTLAWHGIPLALGTDFDAFEPDAHLAALEGRTLAEPDRTLRRLLTHVLGQAGFEGLAEEWWHVSFGDQRWALHHGGPARYGPIAPPTKPDVRP